VVAVGTVGDGTEGVAVPFEHALGRVAKVLKVVPLEATPIDVPVAFGAMAVEQIQEPGDLILLPGAGRQSHVGDIEAVVRIELGLAGPFLFAHRVGGSAVRLDREVS
jgi:hypothetical protein